MGCNILLFVHFLKIFYQKNDIGRCRKTTDVAKKTCKEIVLLNVCYSRRVANLDNVQSLA